MLIIFHHFRVRSNIAEISVFIFLNLFILKITLFFLIDDEFFDGIKSILSIQNSIAMVVFFWLMLLLKSWIIHCWHHFVSKNKENRESYKDIEDKVFMEEYEDVTQ